MLLKGQVHDETSCIFELRGTLFQFYMLQGVLTVVFLLIPVILVKCAEMQESRRAAEKYDESAVDYTLLQYQAKCCDLAPYQFDSWGGSIVEDFLEVVINFALLSMFSVLVPMIAILAVPVNIMVFRLMAFRMTRITCRPEPHGAEGIGFWESGVRGISQVAVVVNMACNVFLRWPLRDLPFGQKATWFIGLEHIALAVAAAAVYILPLPSDVGVIAKYNEMLKSTLTPYAPLPQPRAEKYDYSRVDIGMAPSTSTVSKRASHPQDQSWQTFW